MTTREDFEAVFTSAKAYTNETTGDYLQPYLQAWQAWQAATDAALERAAVKCDELAEDYLAKYLASQATRQQTNLDYLDGASDAAEICTAEIRALKDADTC